jgi:hypothetical protein
MEAETAVQRVLSTVELLSNILAHLTFRDLVNVQRVSRSFRNTVATTPAIQEALFLRPTWDVTHSAPNPLLHELWFRDDRDTRGPSSQWLDATLEEFVSRRVPGEEDTEALRRPEASWRKMLIVQPPVMRLVVHELREESGDGIRM